MAIELEIESEEMEVCEPGGDGEKKKKKGGMKPCKNKPSRLKSPKTTSKIRRSFIKNIPEPDMEFIAHDNVRNMGRYKEAEANKANYKKNY